MRLLSHLLDETHTWRKHLVLFPQKAIKQTNPTTKLLGSGEEQVIAATVFALLCIQLGGGDEAEEGFKMLRPVLTSLLIDNSASIAARQSVSTQDIF